MKHWLEAELSWTANSLVHYGYIKTEAEWQSFVDYMDTVVEQYFEDKKNQEEQSA